MKKRVIIIIIFFAISILIYLNTKKDIKVIITYKYTDVGIEIQENNKSNKDVFLFLDLFHIYREKYNDTLYITSLRNGKQEKWPSLSETKNGITTNACPTLPRGIKVFEIDKLIGIDKKQNEKVRLALIKKDSIFFTRFKDYPSFYFIKPNMNIIIKFKKLGVLEKGRYKLFLDKKEHNEIKKVLENSVIPKEFRLLDSDEIEDNPLEFEVK
jgi:hypothetical protein